MRAARTQRTMSNLPAQPQPATFKRHATELGAEAASAVVQHERSDVLEPRRRPPERPFAQEDGA